MVVFVVVEARALSLASSSLHGQVYPPLERLLFPKRPFPLLPHVGRDHLVRLSEVKVYHDPDEDDHDELDDDDDSVYEDGLEELETAGQPRKDERV